MKRLIIYFYIFFLALTSSSCSILKISHRFNTTSPKIALVIPTLENESVFSKHAMHGLKRFKQDYKNAQIKIISNVSKSSATKVFTRLAKNKFDLIIGAVPAYSEDILKVSKEYADSFFCILDGEKFKAPNVCSFTFKYEQYGYLIGIVAGLNTSSNKVGLVLKKYNPNGEKIISGIKKSLQNINPKAELFISYIENPKNIEEGKLAGLELINEGVDVISHLADIAGVGLIKSAEEKDILVIGGVEDQHELAPNTIITSTTLDVSELVYLVCQNYIEKTLKPGIFSYGLKDQLIDLSPSYGNIDPTVETRVNKYKYKLTEGELSK